MADKNEVHQLQHTPRPLGEGLGVRVFCFLFLIMTFTCFAFGADTTPPTSFEITTPTQSSESSNNYIQWSASVDDTGIDKVTYDIYVDGSKEVTLPYTDLFYTITRTLVDGAHTVYAIARDPSSNETSTDTITFFVNTINPTIEIYYDGALLADSTTIRKGAKIHALFRDDCGVSKTSAKLIIDSVVVSTSNYYSDTSDYPTTIIMTFDASSSHFSSGVHSIGSECKDRFNDSSSTTLSSITVIEGSTISGTPMNYPNPFKPNSGQKTKITYTLSDDSNIILYITDATGRILRKISPVFGASSSGIGSGGKLGYNEGEGDGTNQSGHLVGNGVYLYLITSSEKIIGSGQIAKYD